MAHCRVEWYRAKSLRHVRLGRAQIRPKIDPFGHRCICNNTTATNRFLVGGTTPTRLRRLFRIWQLHVLLGRILSGFAGSIMNRTVVVGVGGAFALAAMMLSTTAGYTQTQTNTQSAIQGQTQSTASSSTSYGTSASGSAADASNASLNAGSQNGINFNSPAAPTNTTAKITNVPNVYAPGLAAAGSEVCLGSISAGGSGAGFGLTIGGTIVDRECQLRLNARTLAVLGYPVAARETMCLDPDVRQAMLAAGTPCAGDRYAYAPSGAYRRADVADPRNSRAAVAPVQVAPVQNEPRQTVSAPESTSGRHLACSRAATESGSCSVAGTSFAMGRVLRPSRRRRLIRCKTSRRCNKLFGGNPRLLLNRRKRISGNP